MKLIVGLGNPGDKYQSSRHNLGFMVLEEYAKKKLGTEFKWEIEDKLYSSILKLNNDLWLVKPQTFMNNSGLAVSKIASSFKVAPENLIIVHDELDLPLGKIKVRLGGGTGGHRGVDSVMKSLGSEKFIRLRLGIGNVKSHSGEHKRVSFNAEKFVLDPFASNERSKVKHMIKWAILALDTVLDLGLEVAQNQYN